MVYICDAANSWINRDARESKSNARTHKALARLLGGFFLYRSYMCISPNVKFLDISENKAPSFRFFIRSDDRIDVEK